MACFLIEFNNELISLYKAYNNDVMIYQITDIVNHVIHMYQSMDDTAVDDSDTLDFVKKQRTWFKKTDNRITCVNEMNNSDQINLIKNEIIKYNNY